MFHCTKTIIYLLKIKNKKIELQTGWSCQFVVMLLCYIANWMVLPVCGKVAVLYYKLDGVASLW
jgi:hypothetical protein